MSQIETRTCKACKQKKPSSDFHKRGVRCLVCLKEARANKKGKSEQPKAEKPIENAPESCPQEVDEHSEMRGLISVIMDVVASDAAELNSFKSKEEQIAYILAKLDLK